MNFVVRPFDRSEDIPAFVRLRREIEDVDRTGNDTSDAAAVSTLDWPGHDPARDRWTAWTEADTGAMAGYSFVWAQSPERSIVYATVRPDLRRRGIGGRLLEASLMRSAGMGVTHATSAVEASNTAGAAFLASRGFSRAGENRFYVADADTDAPEPTWPPGYSVRDFASVGDLHILAGALNRSYGDMWGHRENTPGAVDPEYLAHELEAHPELRDPRGIFIVFAPDGSISGVVTAIRRPSGPGREPDLVVDSPGVVPCHRHLGLQRHLVLTAMRWLRAGGSSPVTLETFGDSDEAFSIYEDLGFELQARYIDHRRPLTRVLPGDASGNEGDGCMLTEDDGF